MRQQEASASRQRLRQQGQELDHMRQQLLSHSHHQVGYYHIEGLLLLLLLLYCHIRY